MRKSFIYLVKADYRHKVGNGHGYCVYKIGYAFEPGDRLRELQREAVRSG